MEKEDDKKKTVCSFNIIIPIPTKLSISATDEWYKKFQRLCNEDDKNKTEILIKVLKSELKKADINGFQELLEQSGNYKLLKREVSDALLSFLPVPNLSRCITGTFEKEFKKRWKDEEFK